MNEKKSYAWGVGLAVFFCVSLFLDIPHALTSEASSLKQRIQSELSAGKRPYGISASTIAFYKRINFQPVWIDKQGWNICAQKFLDTLAHAERDGLDSRYYQRAVQQARNIHDDVLMAELLLTDKALQYIDDVRNGRFNPRLADKQLVVKPDPVNAVQLLYNSINTQSCEWIEQLGPHYQEYHLLKQQLAHYQMLANQGGWPKLPNNVKLVPNDDREEVEILRTILVKVGDLSPDNATGTLFDLNVQEALKRFQARHGVVDDGWVGTNTLAHLNTTAAERVRQIKIAMERWRWMPRNPGKHYIQVNIPRFELKAVADGQVVLRSPIIIGMTYRETPVFSVDIQAIRFNPSWHIPRGIFVQDKLPKILQDSSYIRRRGYIVYDRSGRRVNPSSVNWSAGRSRGFPYQLRQPPGSKNALGKIRFTMPNRFNIYLHDTGLKELFDRNVRTFSSGCIRVKKALELATFVFDNPVQWPQSVIAENMRGRKTRNVSLSRRVPVHVTYFTTWVDDNGRPHFVADVYGQDKQVWQTLKRQQKKS